MPAAADGLPSFASGGDGGGSSGAKTSVVWFRRDLRVEDNPALAAGVRAGTVVALFIWAPEEEGHYYPGRVSRWWLSQSLQHLDSSLRSMGTSLVTKRSLDTAKTLLDVVRSTGATQVLFNHLYDPLSLVRDHQTKELLTARGISVSSFNADLLYEPWEVNDDDGKPFFTFAAFWSKCLSMPYDPPAPLLPPKKIIPGNVSCCPSDNLAFEDESEKASNALLARAWSPGWRNADKALTSFVNGQLLKYSINRKKADSASTSLLSPCLHFGEISIRKVFHLIRMKQIVWANEGNSAGEESVALFLKSIGMREYSRYFSFNHPCSHERPLLSHLRFFPWVVDESYFKAWRQGRTGYPLVDAGMRELWATGWLHDRIRVVVSSFLVKVLQLPWRWGMKYFWDTLLDADLECDALGWQYISGTLPDGREFVRIDNPQFEGYKFDPEGEYVRRWLPELVRLPTEWIHHPWDAPEFVLQASGVELGFNYPLPVVGIDEAKERLHAALAEMWQIEAASRAAAGDGMEEGLGDSSEVPPIDFPQELRMEVDEERVRATNHTATTPTRRHGDQMVPTVSFSLVRINDGGESIGSGFDAEDSNSSSGRGEVPAVANVDNRRHNEVGTRPPRSRADVRRDVTRQEAAAESSSSWFGREGGVVPVWSHPSASSNSDHIIPEEAEVDSSAYVPRHSLSRQLVNWQQLSPTR